MAQLVVALDLHQPDDAERLVDRLYELDLIYKVGMEALYGYGDRIFSYLESRDARHFIDAKLHDIPRTVGSAVKQLVRHGTHIINVHALGGSEMMREAVSAARERASELHVSPPPHVFAVTLLTSMNARDVAEIGLQGDPLHNALHLARLSQAAGCTGVVCSAHEAAAIKSELGADFLALTPGIRPAGAQAGDQKRIMTPQAAVRAGADYLVVGRPITRAADPLAAAQAILEEMG